MNTRISAVFAFAAASAAFITMSIAGCDRSRSAKCGADGASVCAMNDSCTGMGMNTACPEMRRIDGRINCGSGMSSAGGIYRESMKSTAACPAIGCGTMWTANTPCAIMVDATGRGCMAACGKPMACGNQVPMMSGMSRMMIWMPAMPGATSMTPMGMTAAAGTPMTVCGSCPMCGNCGSAGMMTPVQMPQMMPWTVMICPTMPMMPASMAPAPAAPTPDAKPSSPSMSPLTPLGVRPEGANQIMIAPRQQVAGAFHPQVGAVQAPISENPVCSMAN